MSINCLECCLDFGLVKGSYALIQNKLAEQLIENYNSIELKVRKSIELINKVPLVEQMFKSVVQAEEYAKKKGRGKIFPSLLSMLANFSLGSSQNNLVQKLSKADIEIVNIGLTFVVI